MDNNETNRLQNKTALEETLLSTAGTAIEQTASEKDPEVEECVNVEVPQEVKPESKPTVEAQQENEAIEKPKSAAKVKRKKATETEEVVLSEKKQEEDKEAEESTSEAIVDQGNAEKEEQKSVVPTTRQEVIDQLNALISENNDNSKDKIDYLKQTFYKIQKAENEVENKESEEEDKEAKAPVQDNLESELKNLLNVWRERRAEKNALDEKVRQQNIEKKLKIIEDIKNLTESTEDIGRTLPEFRRLQQAWKDTGNVPQEQVNDLWKKYQTQVERFYDLLKINNEFREYDFKKNLEIKTDLCVKAEKLDEEQDVVVAFRQLQKLHEDWRETGPVAKDIREDLWNRFKNASSSINKKHQQFFERLKAAENDNLTQKTEICEKVEAIDYDQLKTYKDWDSKTAEIIQLQEQWKSIGFAPKKVNNKVFDRFRTACDTFFHKKSEFYKASKEILSQNLEKKKALCDKAESLKDSTEWKATTDLMIQIQKEWKTIGPVPKKVSDSIWKRFISACDFFFEQKEKLAPSHRNEEISNMTVKKELIEQMANISPEIPEDEALNVYKELISKWNNTGHVPFKEKDNIYKEWHEALDKQTERLNISKEARRLSKFQENLDDMNNKGQGKVLHERERLLRQFDNLNSEIKTAENNIGFFTKSKSSKSNLLTDMDKKIEALKEERDLIYKKIKIIDDQL